MQFANRTRSPRLEKAFELILPKLQQVEETLERQFTSPVRSVSDIGEHVLEAGGKRLRPALLLVIARALGYQGDLDVLYGAVVESIHTATLVHDDVIDEANLRRGRVSANARWGNNRVVLFGDWLYTRALKGALDVGDLRILRLLNDAILAMVEGEILALESLGSIELAEQRYFEILRRKTAVLFSVTCEIPAHLGGGEHADRLREYGLQLGTAFQIVDDLLDFSSSEKVVGKPVLSDLREGKVTLPLLLTLKSLAAAERADVETVLRERDFASVPTERILRIVERHGALEKARAMAEEAAEKARTAVEGLPPGEAREALLYAPEFILTREL
jgi:octaprenyl-diphosphate synthase